MPSHDPVHFSVIEDYISTTFAKEVAGAMDKYMQGLPRQEINDPYANIPVDGTPSTNVIAEQDI